MAIVLLDSIQTLAKHQSLLGHLHLSNQLLLLLLKLLDCRRVGLARSRAHVGLLKKIQLKLLLKLLKHLLQLLF